MTIYEMVQDSNGILWMGTENGLVSYNGEEFTTYTHPDLKDNDIIEIALSSDGSILFFNISDQLGRLKNGQIEIIFVGNAHRYDVISSIERDYVIELNNKFGLITLEIYGIDQEKLIPFTNLNTKIPKPLTCVGVQG